MSDTTDTTEPPDERLENYRKIERKQGSPGSHRASKELLRRPRVKGRKTRLEAFSGIDHGNKT